MAVRNTIQLLSNAAATGNPQYVSIGGTYQYLLHGTFSGATCKLQVLGPDGTNQIDLSSDTAAVAKSVDIAVGSTVKVTISAGPPSAMYATLNLIRAAK